LRTPQNNRRSAIPDGVMPTSMQTASAFARTSSPAAFNLFNIGLASTSTNSASPRSLFSQLMSTGLASADDPRFAPVNPEQAAALLWPSQAVDWPQISPALQPDAAQDAADNGPTRFLVGRTSDPSQDSPLVARAAPPQPSLDKSLSLSGAYLEYLKRMNVA
jgi:hypothetical protein